MFADLQSLLPAVSRRVDLWDTISVGSLIALFVFEIASVLLGIREKLKRVCERLGLVSLGILALADYQVHRYRMIENGLLSDKQAAFEKLVSDQSDSIAHLEDQVQAANAAASRAIGKNATLLAMVKSQSLEIVGAEKQQQEAEKHIQNLRLMAMPRWVDEKPFLEALKDQPKPDGTLIAFAEDSDSEMLAHQIMGLLYRAGWRVYVPTPITRPANTPSYLSSAEALGGNSSGVSIVSKLIKGWDPARYFEKNFKPQTPYDALWLAFQAAKFPSFHGGWDDSLPENVVRIVVGPKESPIIP